MYEEFKSLIISGSYIDVINEIKERREKDIQGETKTNLVNSNKNIKDTFINAQKDRKTKLQPLDTNMQTEKPSFNIEDPDIVLHSITSHEDESLYSKESNEGGGMMEHQFITPINITTSASDKALCSVFVDDEDETSCDNKNADLSLDLLPPSHNMLPPSSSNPVNPQNVIASGSRVQQHATATVASSEEDNVIQDLLEDIRGSFERQFDDEFNFDGRWVRS